MYIWCREDKQHVALLQTGPPTCSSQADKLKYIVTKFEDLTHALLKQAGSPALDSLESKFFWTCFIKTWPPARNSRVERTCNRQFTCREDFTCRLYLHQVALMQTGPTTRNFHVDKTPTSSLIFQISKQSNPHENYTVIKSIVVTVKNQHFYDHIRYISSSTLTKLSKFRSRITYNLW